jgi:hypothetical protein
VISWIWDEEEVFEMNTDLILMEIASTFALVGNLTLKKSRWDSRVSDKSRFRVRR